jgi:hypothetical protein
VDRQRVAIKRRRLALDLGVGDAPFEHPVDVRTVGLG